MAPPPPFGKAPHHKERTGSMTQVSGPTGPAQLSHLQLHRHPVPPVPLKHGHRRSHPVPAYPGAPNVTHMRPRGIRQLDATLTASFNASGGSTGVFFDFGTTTQYFTAASRMPPFGKRQPRTPPSPACGRMVQNTIYHYRVRAATPTGGSSKGGGCSFTVQDTGFPAVTTAARHQYKPPRRANVKGFVSAHNGPTTTAAFEYGLRCEVRIPVPVSGRFGGFSFQRCSTEHSLSDANVTY